MDLEFFYDLVAEKAVLGAVLIRPEALDDVTDLLAPEHFRREAHQRIFAAMLALHARGVASDILTVRDELLRRYALDAVGGPAYLSSLMDGIPRTTRIVLYANIVRDKALLYRLWEFGIRTADDARGGALDGQKLLEQVEQDVMVMGQQATASAWVSGAALAAQITPLIEQIGQLGELGAITGVPSGFKDLDTTTRGFHPGDVTVVGARPGSGKTALALQLATHAALGGAVAMFSVEMALEPLGFRIVASQGRVDGFRMMSGVMGEDEYQRVGVGLSALANLPVYFDEAPSLSPVQVRSKLRRLRAQVGPLRLVVIDYLQLMAPMPDDRHENKTNRVAGISRALKIIARELKTPFVVLAQLNRTLERAADKRPTLADLRDSGAIEQDADVVLFIHRPEMYDTTDKTLEGVAELIIGKQRNGPTGTVALKFHKDQMRFEGRR